MKKVLLFDLDGVIRFYPKERDDLIEEKHRLPNGAIAKIAFKKDLLDQAVSGKITDDKWRDKIKYDLIDQFGEERGSPAFHEWNNFLGTLNHPLIKIIKKYQDRAQIVLLTNGTTRLHGDLDKLGIDKLFHQIFSSHMIGLFKPDPNIFDHVTKSLQKKAHEVFFIDDSLSNVRTALVQGFHGLHYHHTISVEEIENNILKFLGETV